MVIWKRSSALPPHPDHIRLLSPPRYNSLWGCTVTGSENWYSKNSGVGGEWVKPIFSQTRSLITLITWLSIYQNWHKHDGKDVDWFNLWKKVWTILLDTHITTVWSPPLPLCQLYCSSGLSLNQLNSLIQQWVVLNWATLSQPKPGHWAELAQWWVQRAELAQSKWWEHDCGSRKKTAGSLLSAAATF